MSEKLTPEKLVDLRRIAEAAPDPDDYDYSEQDRVDAFLAAFDPPTALALLDALDEEKRHYKDECRAMDRVEDRYQELVESLENNLAAKDAEIERLEAEIERMDRYCEANHHG